MTPKQTESLLQLMAKLGVYHLKTPLIEAHRNSYDAPEASPEPSPQPIPSPEPKESIVEPAGALKQAIKDSPEIPIPHTDEELASLMKLSDQELLDRLIPDASPQDEEQE